MRAENHFGQFVFPKAVLCEKGIVFCNGKEGKRAMLIYPPWDKADNSQARKTQAWQLQYFIKFSEDIFDFSGMRYLKEWVYNAVQYACKNHRKVRCVFQDFP